jgi:hypothetical protein
VVEYRDVHCTGADISRPKGRRWIKATRVEVFRAVKIQVEVFWVVRW